VELSDDDDTATLSLQDEAGADVAGDFAMDGDMLWFTPAEPLMSNSSYTAMLNYCGSEDAVSIAFTTSALGAEVDGGGDGLIGHTYAVDLSSGNFVQPAGVGDLIGSMLENNILLSVTSTDGGDMSMRGALSEAGNSNQDYCTQTLDSFPSADFSENPYFEIDAPEGIDLSVSGMSISIDSLFISGTFAQDASYFGGAELKGELDARTLGPLLEELVGSADPEEICGLLVGFGISCESCSSDGEMYCVTLEVNQLVAESVGDGVDLVCDVDCHELCTENATECAAPQLTDLAECPTE
jgi:hypothetical protein